MGRTVIVTARVEPDVASALDRFAAGNRLSRSSAVEAILETLRDGRLVFVPPSHSKPEKGGRDMRIEIVLGSGAVVPTHVHEGGYFAEVPTSGTYKIRLRNDTPHRRLAVVSVDGLDVTNGEPAKKHGNTGYVLSPWQSVEIPGWRRSDTEVAAFELAAPDGSYSAQTGQGKRNVGVVGVAVYDEKAPAVTFPVFPWVQTEGVLYGASSIHVRRDGHFHPDSSRICDIDYSDGHSTSCSMDSEPVPMCAPACVMSDSLDYERSARGPIRSRSISRGATKGMSPISESAPTDVGTGYGQKTAFRTMETTFARRDEPTEVLSVRYATREMLRLWGVPVDRPRPEGAPNPFPGETADCPAPPGWRG